MSHPSGLPGEKPGATCGGCAWFAEGRCRFAAVGEAHGPAVFAQSPACGFHEPPVTCEPCGACCREAFDSVPVTDADLLRLADHADIVRHHDDGWRDLQRVPSPLGKGTRCICLAGDGAGTPFRCTRYAVRPSNCRDLERGSEGCLEARRRVGLTPWRPGQRPEGPWATD